MRFVTKDADDKPDTPLSVWIGLIFVLTAIGMKRVGIGPGGLGVSWDLGIPAFFLITGLTVLIPGFFLTVLRRPE